jgi:hypothetical protein
LIRHGFNKKLNRGKQILKKTTGISDELSDVLYDSIMERFEFMNQHIPDIEKSIHGWMKTIKEHLDTDVLFVTILEEVYYADKSMNSSTLEYQSLLKKYRQGRDRVLNGPYKGMQRQLKQIIYPALHTLHNLFKTPQIVIRKREAKVLDYERYQELLQKKAEIEPSLKESAEAYESINAQLCEEIPMFLNFCLEYIHIVMEDIVKLQQTFFDESRMTLIELYGAMAMDPMSTTDEITQKYICDMELGGSAEVASRDIKILHKWREDIWENGHFKPNPADKKVNDGLIDVQGGIGAPRLVHSTIDSDYVLRSHVTLQVMHPNVLPDFDYQVKALYPFQAEFEDELDLEIGDIITIITNEERHGSDEWKFGTSGRGQGWFPRNFAERI